MVGFEKEETDGGAKLKGKRRKKKGKSKNGQRYLGIDILALGSSSIHHSPFIPPAPAAAGFGGQAFIFHHSPFIIHHSYVIFALQFQIK